MPTITNREIVDTVIANNGIYPGDEHIPVIRIVEYNNDWTGAIAWGFIYEGDDPMRYHNAPACHNPRIIFERN